MKDNAEVAIADAVKFLRGLPPTDIREVAVLHAAQVLRRAKTLPQEELDTTAEFLMDALRPRRRGRHSNRAVTRTRNWVIAYTVSRIAQKFGLLPTRSRATQKTESACSIVAEACRRLRQGNISEAAINKIWQTREVECGDGNQPVFIRIEPQRGGGNK